MPTELIPAKNAKEALWVLKQVDALLKLEHHRASGRIRTNLADVIAYLEILAAKEKENA